jgi:hypothetical protein
VVVDVVHVAETLNVVGEEGDQRSRQGGHVAHACGYFADSGRKAASLRVYVREKKGPGVAVVACNDAGGGESIRRLAGSIYR